MRLRFSYVSVALALVAFPLFADIPGVGSPTPFNLPNAGQIAVGPDGNIWTLTLSGKIGKLTPAGAYTEFPLQFPPPTNGASFNATAFAFGIDGNLWVTALNGHVERMTTSGAVTDFAVGPSFYLPFPVVTGADGAIWFFGQPNGGNNTWQLTRMDIYGQSTSYDLGISDLFPAGDRLTGLLSGGDGNLWFIDKTKNQAVKFSLITKSIAGSFAIPSPEAQFTGDQTIVAWDGNVWFTHGTSIDRVTPGGTVTEFHVPSGDKPDGILMSGDNNIWFTEPGSGRLGQLVMSSITPGGTATINETAAGGFTNITQLFILPPTFAGSPGVAHKLGIVPNDNCTETRLRFNTDTGKVESFQVQLTPPCFSVAEAAIIGTVDPLGAASLALSGHVKSSSLDNVRALTARSAAQTGTMTAIINLTALSGMTITSVTSDDPSITTSFSGLTATLTKSVTSLPDTFSAKISLSPPQGGAAPALAGAMVISSSMPDPFSVNHVTSFFLAPSAGNRAALPSNPPTVITTPVSRGK